jgi:hypothetical protein
MLVEIGTGYSTVIMNGPGSEAFCGKCSWHARLKADVPALGPRVCRYVYQHGDGSTVDSWVMCSNYLYIYNKLAGLMLLNISGLRIIGELKKRTIDCSWKHLSMGMC